MIVKCKVCNSEFNCTPSRLRPNGNCCSKQCQSIDFKGKDNVECYICGKNFHLKPHSILEKNCCSVECLKIRKREMMLGENNHQYGLKGELNSSYNGGKKISTYGYVLILSHDHPFKTKSNYVFEHRLIAEKFLLTDENSIIINNKKYLKKEYEVHHIDENRLNNSVENLLVLTKGEHAKLHNLKNPVKRDKTTGRFISADTQIN